MHPGRERQARIARFGRPAVRRVSVEHRHQAGADV
jgi:hypothetical protein